MELCGSSAACSDDGNAAAAGPGPAPAPGTPTIVTSEDGDGAMTLSGLVEELKDELRKQKNSYEARVQRLEECGAALRLQTERLQQEAEQELKRRRMLEIKLRNSERARDDAENRNRLLEREMEDFFSTLGGAAPGARTSDI
ncbi:Rho GTPase-activating protein 22 [Liparis tanakae]|uniref:Rho GTPase-activating protein 22 n=1 Tax=Liparis tanakae TaxID=230148 RepID=A0A4Z2EYS7_9TELE|nr:Rho GTPase-activating protein 22 [Liparis tanakae]